MDSILLYYVRCVGLFCYIFLVITNQPDKRYPRTAFTISNNVTYRISTNYRPLNSKTSAPSYKRQRCL